MNQVIIDAYSKTVARAAITGKPGKLSVNFTFTPKGDNRFFISAQITTKQPDFSPEMTGFMPYINTKTGELFREDPNQPSLPFEGPDCTQEQNNNGKS